MTICLYFASQGTPGDPNELWSMCWGYVGGDVMVVDVRVLGDGVLGYWGVFGRWWSVGRNVRELFLLILLSIEHLNLDLGG